MDISTYRARIGLFVGALKCRPPPWKPSVLCLSSKATLVTMFTVLLILAGDVEINPGPPKYNSEHHFRFQPPTPTNYSNQSYYEGNLRGYRPESDDRYMDTMEASQGPPSQGTDILLEIRAELRSMRCEVRDLRGEMGARFDKLECATAKLATENENLKADVQRLSGQVNFMENERRKRCLVLHGVTSDPKKSPYDSLQRFLTADLNLQEKDIRIDGVRRLSRSNGTQTPLLVSCASWYDKNLLWDTVKNSGLENVSVKPDLPKEVRETRKKLAKFYDQNKAAGKTVKVTWDKLIVDDKTFRYDSKNDSLIEMTFR